MADEYLNFESALKELKLSEEQLKRLVSEGEIRAIRGDNNSMKFRREEIDKIKTTGKGAETLTDDLLFDEGKDLDMADEGMATAQIGADTTQVGGGGKTAVPSKTDAKAAAKPAPASPVRSTRASGRSTAAPAAAPAVTSAARRSTVRAGGGAPVADDGSGAGAGMVAALAVASLVCLFAAMVWWDTANDHASGATKGISTWAFETFGK